MSNATWEVVGGKKKENLSKNAKKQKVKNMPKLIEAGPLPEDKTLFEAFLEREKRAEENQKKPEAKTNGTTDLKKKNNVNVPAKKKTLEKKKEVVPMTFEENAAQINLKDMKSLLETVQNRFPETPSIWLKDLASFLNVKFHLEVSDPTFGDKTLGFPSAVLSKGIYNLLKGTVVHCTPQTLQLFYEYCLSTMVEDVAKNLPTFGFRIFLQIMAQERPSLIVNNLSKMVELRNACQNRHQACLSVLWAAGQAGLTDLKAGLEVWLTLMFPVIGTKAFAKFTVDYLDSLLKHHPGVKSATEILTVQEFFPLFDFLYLSPGLQASHHKQLLGLYPKIKALAYGSNPEPILRNFFPHYLSRLQNTVSAVSKEELLSSLLECLTLDKQSYSAWRQLYTKHMLQSSILLKHLAFHFDQLPSKFPKKLLKETLNAFHVTNEEIPVHKRTVSDGYKQCSDSCKELLTRMSVSGFPWRFLVFFCFLSASALVLYDVRTHGSFKASTTGIYLKNYGVLAASEQAVSKIVFYSCKAYSYLEKTVPVYYGETCKHLGPYLRQFWSSLLEVGGFLWESSLPLRQWMNLNVPPLLQKVEDNFPKLFSQASVLLISVVECFKTYLLLIWNQTVVYGNRTGLWLQENLFNGQFSLDKLQIAAGDLVGGLQELSKSAYQWLLQTASNF